MIHEINAEHLSIETIEKLLPQGSQLKLCDDARQRIVKCRTYLDQKIAESDRPVYGVNTGFGSLCDISINHDQLAQLQINLIQSHACGMGDRVPKIGRASCRERV